MEQDVLEDRSDPDFGPLEAEKKGNDESLGSFSGEQPQSEAALERLSQMFCPP